MEEEVERETEFLQGVVISWPSSCFSAGTSFCAAESWHKHARTYIHTHMAVGVGVEGALRQRTCQCANHQPHVFTEHTYLPLQHKKTLPPDNHQKTVVTSCEF